jgi:hypothetical protein
MTSIPTCGQVGFGDHRIDIVDCRLWQLQGRTPVCTAGHDLAACGTCPHRVSREGNLIDPPILAGTMPQAASAPAAAPAPPRERMRGLGDAVARVTKAVGIKPCGGCQKRRELLNKAFPFKQNPPPEG